MKLVCSALLVFAAIWCSAQKVGLVLSGGGASGLAHIGVLKALEENNIPVDYICGTSSGALIGALYAIGYTPAEMEALVKSDAFRKWTYGKTENSHNYYFKKEEDNASWIQYKLDPKSGLQNTLPTNIIDSKPVDFGLLSLFAEACAAAHYNFDSLMIPFRCMASDIDSKQSVVFKQGDLGVALRASMSYPFYLKPIVVEGKLLFDGGLYNNFPADVLLAQFHPDYIIGSNVTGRVPPPGDDNLVSQIRSMMTGTTNYTLQTDKGLLIEPKTETGLFDFEDPQRLIDSGYVSTIRKMKEIKKAIGRKTDTTERKKQRIEFLNKQQELSFDKILISGLNENQRNYVQRCFRTGSGVLTLAELKRKYFQLAADDKIKDLFPQALFNKQSGKYDLLLKMKKEKDLVASVGGDLSNRPISEGFVDLKYNYLGKDAVTIEGNTYFGRLYSSAQGKVRIDFPTRIPFYIEPAITYNRWDYYNSSELFFVDLKPAYLIQNEQHEEMNFGIPLDGNGKLAGGVGYTVNKNQYYQTSNFTPQDTADQDKFSMTTSYLMYENNTFNRKMYPSEGHYFLFRARFLSGEEYNQPGSTGIVKQPASNDREWLQLKSVYDNYFIYRGRIKLGVMMEGVYSNQNLSYNYASSILSAPAFSPTPETQTLFLNNYRAYNYLAAGLKNIISFRKNLELRTEAYLFMPYQSILEDNSDLQAHYGGIFGTKHYILSSAAVYTTPVGPISFSVNYYDRQVTPLTFLFHFGYILFNKRAMD
jgi:NTE family protein